MSDSKLEAIDRVDTLQICLQAVADLITPRTELQEVHLDGIGVLMAYLLEHQQSALKELQAL